MKGEIEILVITIVKYHRDFSTLYCMWDSTCINKECRRRKEKEILTQMGLSSPTHVLARDGETGEKEENYSWANTEQPKRCNMALLWFGIMLCSSES